MRPQCYSKFFQFPWSGFSHFSRSYFEPSALSSNLQSSHLPFKYKLNRSSCFLLLRENRSHEAKSFLTFCHASTTLTTATPISLCDERDVPPAKDDPFICSLDPLSPATLDVMSILLDTDIDEYLFPNCPARYKKMHGKQSNRPHGILDAGTKTPITRNTRPSCSALLAWPC